MIRRDPVNHANTSREFLLQEIAFVQEQYNLRLAQQLVRADHLPQLVAVLQPIDAPVLRELLVEAADRREEDDRVHVVEVGWPLGALGYGVWVSTYIYQNGDGWNGMEGKGGGGRVRK